MITLVMINNYCIKYLFYSCLTDHGRQEKKITNS